MLLQVDIERAEQAFSRIENPRFREFVYQAIERAYKGDTQYLEMASNFRRYPVGVEEFICSKEYLNAQDSVWPAVMESLIELNSGPYVEAVLTGAIGTAKTTIALYTTAYQLYQLSCLKSPHKVYHLDPTSEIEFIFQSMTTTLAKAVDYMRFKNMIRRCPYFQVKFPFNRLVVSELRFPFNILVKPVSGASTAAIGQNVIGGVIDELNFMAVVAKSARDPDGYNQAEAIYDSIARRRKSRFIQHGRMPGILCLVSSKRYPGQFTDKKVDEARSDPSIFVYDKTTWDVKPEGTFLGPRFKVFSGTESQKPYIIGDDPIPDANVIDVPIEYKKDFERDIMGALRDIAGISTIARFPYIPNPEVVKACQGKVLSCFSVEGTDFANVKCNILPERLTDHHKPRFAHVDLGLTGDSAGVSLGYCSGFKTVDRGNNQFERLPIITFDGVLEVFPPPAGEILFHKIRTLFYILRDQLKLNIRWVTYDSFQSTDSLQLLRGKGFTVGHCSTDLTNHPYDFAKAAFGDARVLAPTHARALKEFGALEKDTKKGKIDHPVGGSKDCSDSMACVIFGLTMQRHTWVENGVPITEIPPSIREAITKKEQKKERRVDAVVTA